MIDVIFYLTLLTGWSGFLFVLFGEENELNTTQGIGCCAVFISLLGIIGLYITAIS